MVVVLGGAIVKKLEDRSVIETIFETGLWQSRWAVLVAVICSVSAALLMFYIACVDTFYTVEEALSYAAIGDYGERGESRASSVAQVVEVIDIFLLAIVLLIFGLGLYELYISKIQHAYEDGDQSAEHLLAINSLDDLKVRLGKVIMMILIVKFFEIAIGLETDDIVELLMFAGGVMMSGAALMLTELANSGGNKRRVEDSVK